MYSWCIIRTSTTCLIPGVPCGNNCVVLVLADESSQHNKRYCCCRLIGLEYHVKILLFHILLWDSVEYLIRTSPPVDAKMTLWKSFIRLLYCKKKKKKRNVLTDSVCHFQHNLEDCSIKLISSSMQIKCLEWSGRNDNAHLGCQLSFFAKRYAELRRWQEKWKAWDCFNGWKKR